MIIVAPIVLNHVFVAIGNAVFLAGARMYFSQCF